MIVQITGASSFLGVDGSPDRSVNLVSLKAAIEKSKPNRVKCSVSLFKAKLSPAQRSELDEACATSVDELTHAVLARAIKTEWPDLEPTIQPGTLQRHRSGQCSCDA